jgi:hypothetical protein
MADDGDLMVQSSDDGEGQPDQAMRADPRFSPAAILALPSMVASSNGLSAGDAERRLSDGTMLPTSNGMSPSTAVAARPLQSSVRSVE